MLLDAARPILLSTRRPGLPTVRAREVQHVILRDRLHRHRGAVNDNLQALGAFQPRLRQFKSQPAHVLSLDLYSAWLAPLRLHLAQAIVLNEFVKLDPVSAVVTQVERAVADAL